MVEDNNNNGSSNTESAPRKRLFGGRKSAKKPAEAPALEAPVAPPVVPEAPRQVPEAPTEVAAGFDEEHPGLAPLEPATKADTPAQAPVVRPTTSLIFQAPDIRPLPPARRR